MPRRRVIRTTFFAAGIVAAVLTAGPVTRGAAVSAPTFGTPITLPSSQGGEPSIAIDTSNCSVSSCYIYVVSPNGTSSGPAEWHSSDDGATWSAATQIDNMAPCDPSPGGDTDTDVLPNGSVSATDLNLSWATVQLSTDHAATFPGCTETAFEDDRPWLAHLGNTNIYVAYHDFVLEVPIICTSTTASGTNPGTFTCVQAFLSPTQVPNGVTNTTNCAENTVPARALIVDGADNSENFLYSCSTAAENAAHPPYGPLHDYYLARSTDGVTFSELPVVQCTATSTFCPTSGGQAPNLANIFGNLAEDSAGNFYALFSGTVDDNTTFHHPDHVYLTVSKNKGATWTTPVQVDNETTPDQFGRTGFGTHTLAHLAVTSPGNVDVVWYGTTNTGEPNGQCGSTGMVTSCSDSSATSPNGPDGMDFHAAGSATNTGGPVEGNWQVSIAQSTNALCNAGPTPTCTTPTFTQTLVDPNYRHFGTICSNGIVCGGASDRHLLDFISVAVDCNGAAHVTYAADQNSPTVPAETSAARADGSLQTIETNQTGGQLLAPPATCASQVQTPDAPLVPLLPLGAAVAGGAVALGRRLRPRPSPATDP